MLKHILVRGARTHNLKNISVSIPHNQLTVITGVSGSGKSSLAFDTIYAEGQRRYVESLSTYARQFLGIMKKPSIDRIDGLNPAIAIEQKTTNKNPRSTVGTITEIYDYMRLLWANIGIPHSPVTGLPIQAHNAQEIVKKVLHNPENTKIMILAPITNHKTRTLKQELQDIQKRGYTRVFLDEVMYELDDLSCFNTCTTHTLSIVVDRLILKKGIARRLTESIETALHLGNGIIIILDPDNNKKDIFSEKFSCPVSGFTIENLEPRLFSFNSPMGACKTCNGLGIEEYIDPYLVVPDHSLSIQSGAIKPFSNSTNTRYNSAIHAILDFYKEDINTPFSLLKKETVNTILFGTSNTSSKNLDSTSNKKIIEPEFDGVIPILNNRYRTSNHFQRYEISPYLNQKICPVCNGDRLNEHALCVKIGTQNIANISNIPIIDARNWFMNLNLTNQQKEISQSILKEIIDRMNFLCYVGLDYLTLSRASMTLSGGEGQRIRLASQIGSGLVGVLYVLDEPSIGLHQRDNDRLLDMLKHLKNLGNTILIVEHDLDTIKIADYLIDMGPRAGIHGGEIVASGDPKSVFSNKKSLTAAYVTGSKKILVPKIRRTGTGQNLTISGVKKNNLKNITVSIPIGTFTCITGVSGSGKSTLIFDVLIKAMKEKYHHNNNYDDLHGMVYIDKIIEITQSPIGRTPRSNPSTYIGVFSLIREWFANLPESRARGYTASRFSFNVKGGRCEACTGDGVKKIEMHFLPDVYIECESCKGTRYNKDTLEISFNGYSISDILNLTIDESMVVFRNIPNILHFLKILQRVGLGYIQLGQSALTLSGGEAQRIKLAKELSKRSSGKTLYLLDEPSTGLHIDDIKHLLMILHELTDQGNTIIVIEHNLDLIKTADYIIDLGPEGGARGGQIVAFGTPEEIILNKNSYTGLYLKNYLT